MKIPFFVAFQFLRRRQTEILIQRHGMGSRSMDRSEDGIKRIARMKELNQRFGEQAPGEQTSRGGQRLYKRAHRDGQQLIRAVAHDDVFGLAAMKLRKLFPQWFRGRIRIEAQAGIGRFFDRS